MIPLPLSDFMQACRKDTVTQDEAHQSPAVSIERVLAEEKASYIVCLTATPERRDGHHPILYMLNENPPEE